MTAKSAKTGGEPERAERQGLPSFDVIDLGPALRLVSLTHLSERLGMTMQMVNLMLDNLGIPTLKYARGRYINLYQFVPAFYAATRVGGPGMNLMPLKSAHKASNVKGVTEKDRRLPADFKKNLARQMPELLREISKLAASDIPRSAETLLGPVRPLHEYDPEATEAPELQSPTVKTPGPTYNTHGDGENAVEHAAVTRICKVSRELLPLLSTGFEGEDCLYSTEEVFHDVEEGATEPSEPEPPPADAPSPTEIPPAGDAHQSATDFGFGHGATGDAAANPDDGSPDFVGGGIGATDLDPFGDVEVFQRHRPPRDTGERGVLSAPPSVPVQHSPIDSFQRSAGDVSPLPGVDQRAVGAGEHEVRVQRKAGRQSVRRARDLDGAD